MPHYSWVMSLNQAKKKTNNYLEIVGFKPMTSHDKENVNHPMSEMCVYIWYFTIKIIKYIVYI